MKRYWFRPLEEILRIIFPVKCCCCGRTLVGEEHEICSLCLLHLPYTHYENIPDNAMEQRYIGKVEIQQATSLLFFQSGAGTQKLVHEIKYHGNKTLAHSMGRMIGSMLTKSERFNDIDCLVPVPLHPNRERSRGYNQSVLLCEGITITYPCEISIGNLIRTSDTESQTHKSQQERLENIRKAFAVVRPELYKGKHLLLVDDVVTTGATSSACCEVLLQAPDVKVSVVSLTIT